MIPNFKRSDFCITAFTKVAYVGCNVIFDRPSNLTKFDMAYVLNVLQPSLHWFIIYDAFTKRDLVVKLTDVLNNLV